MEQERTVDMAVTFEPPQQLMVEGEDYAFVKTRVYDPISVYEGKDTFLRIGPREKLEQEATFHQQLSDLGFPVPTIVKSGELQGQYYYVEKSFEGQTFGGRFAEQCTGTGEISEASFGDFLVLVEKYTDAQLKTLKQIDWSDSFYRMAHVDVLTQERPDLADQLHAAYEKVKGQLAGAPAVLTHEDFNPHNLFPEGIIDVGDFSYAPAGYDVAMNVFHTYMFPSQGDSEMYRKYAFTPSQISSYFSHIDQLFGRHSLPAPSKYIDDYLVGKVTWSAARMHYRPKLQVMRYDLLDRVTKAYLENKEIKSILFTT